MKVTFPKLYERSDDFYDCMLKRKQQLSAFKYKQFYNKIAFLNLVSLATIKLLTRPSYDTIYLARGVLSTFKMSNANSYCVKNRNEILSKSLTRILFQRHEIKFAQQKKFSIATLPCSLLFPFTIIHPSRLARCHAFPLPTLDIMQSFWLAWWPW